MKRTGYLIKIISFAFVALTVTACQNWMSGDMFSKVEDEVKVATAEKINVYVRFADNSFGTTTPSNLSEQKVDVPFDISAVVNNNYGFYEWAAFTTEDVNPSKNNRLLIYDETYKAEGGYGSKKLDSSVVSFLDPKSESTKCTVLVNRSDIVIVPVVAKRAVLKSRTTYPKTGDEGVVISQRIVLGFDKEMDFGSFVSCKNPSGIFEKDAEGNSVYEDSNGNKFYDWDKNKIEIRVYLNGDVYVGDKSYDYFNLPVQNEYDRTKIIISPNKSKKLPPFSVIEITIAGDVLDSDGYTMAESIEYYYTVGNTDDEGYPIFTAITGGRPRKDAKGINGVENDWSDFKGYLDTTDDSITTKLPSDSQTIDQWNDTAKNPVFTHRVRNSVDIYVKILDTINASLTPNNNTTDNDIENFVIKAKHLLYPDGSKGIGLVPEDKSTQKSYSYSNMKYHTSTKNFAYAHDSEDSYYASEYISNSYILKGETENDTPGFVFPYYFPAMPDGLIKLEFYAVDSIGNSGDAAPYAMYVIKDTTAPDIVSQASKIKSASTTAFTEWFNAETLQGLSFKVDSGNPIYDTFVKSDGAVSQVHSKFNPKKLYWSFGPSVNTMGALTEIDNTGTTAYDMSALTGSISTQGKMSFIAQISDDVGNTSSAVSMNVDVYFDSVSPATVTTSDFSDSQKFYPKTGVTGSETEKTFFTSQSSIPFELSATDSGYYDTTETSSGIAGFLIKEGSDYSAAELKTALKVTNGVLSEPLKTKTQTFSAGASPNASKKDYYVYAVDKALNHSESAVKISVVQDTTGPGISLSDYASYTYDALKEYYKENVPDTDMNCNPGTTGSVRGVLGGKYFYGSNYTGFPFTVTLINECEPYDSGAYGFKVMKNGSEVSGKSGGVSGNVTLEEGEYKIVAFDNLGNETETSTIRIVKDSDVPVVNDFSIIGTTKSGSSSSATKEQNVYVQFTASDKKTNDTGLLSFTLSGDADFTNAKLQKVSGGAASDVSDVIKELSESNTKVTFYLKNPENTEVNYKVTGIKLSDGNGLKTVNLSVKDRTRNLNAENSAVISYANSIPKVEDVLIVSTDKDMLENESLSIATKDTTVSLKLKLQDNASGISRLYINDSDTKSATGIEAPTGNVLLSSESKVLDSAGNEISGVTFVTGQSGEGSYLEFASPVNAETLTGYQITKVKMPESGGSIQEGKNLFYVVAYNEIMNRNDSAVSGSIIYDKTPPKPVVDLMAPEHFNPKLAHVNGSSYTQYYSKNDNTVWVIKSPYYMKGSGDDTRSDGKDSAGFWKATYKVDGGTEKDLSQQTEASVQITGSAEIEVYAYDAINNKSVPNATDKSCFTVKKDITAPVMSDLEIIAATGYTAKKDESLTSDAYF
ncbi:MAG: hypothetical protein HUK25_06520, partial [Treponema sp.]|nr:hypothetical protein [Treponema sp.]